MEIIELLKMQNKIKKARIDEILSDLENDKITLKNAIKEVVDIFADALMLSIDPNFRNEMMEYFDQPRDWFITRVHYMAQILERDPLEPTMNVGDVGTVEVSTALKTRFSRISIDFVEKHNEDDD